MEVRLQNGWSEIGVQTCCKSKICTRSRLSLLPSRPGFSARLLHGLLGRKWIEAQGKTIEQCKAENAGKSTAVKAAPFVLSFIAELMMAGPCPASCSISAYTLCVPAHFRALCLARLRVDHRGGQQRLHVPQSHANRHRLRPLARRAGHHRCDPRRMRPMTGSKIG